MVEKWFPDFKRAGTYTSDAERSGHPDSAVVLENIKKVHKMVLAVRKLKLREIADTLKISEGSIFTILHNAPCHKSIGTMAKSHESHFEFLFAGSASRRLLPVCKPKKNASDTDLASMKK